MIKNLIRLSNSQEGSNICGLVGMAGSIYAKEDKAFKDLLLIDALRGDHSTGVLFVPRKLQDKPFVYKKASDPIWFLEDNEVRLSIAKGNKCLLGHNRFATIGHIIDGNAHPFMFNNIAGAHNGTLRNQRALVDSGDFEVDSANIFHSIEKVGLEETYKVIRGAWALTWWNEEEQTVNFIRNKKRPLSYCYSEDKKTLFWASEGGMLVFILNRRGIKHTEIINTTPHHLYSFKIPPLFKNIEVKITDMTPPLPVVIQKAKKSSTTALNSYIRALPNKYNNEMKEFVVTARFVNDYNQTIVEGEFMDAPYEKVNVFYSKSRAKEAEQWDNGEILLGRCTHYSQMHNTYYVSPHNLDFAYEEKEGDEYVLGYGNEHLGFHEFKERTSQGCAWCGDPIFYVDNVLWLDSKECMCETCARSNETKSYRQDLGL